MNANKFLRTAGPTRQSHVRNGYVIFRLPHLVLIGVHQQFRQVKQLGNQLLETRQQQEKDEIGCER